MNSISPRSHVYRLGAVLAIAVVAFLFIRSYAVPPSWNHEVWYRGADLQEEQQYPLKYGGNESCKSCHEDVSLTEKVEVKGGFEDDFGGDFLDGPAEMSGEVQPEMVFEHKGLSCESCHGALSQHADENDKIGDAVVMNKSNWQCLNCHADLISRPDDVAQFTEDVEDHRDMREQTLCQKCHDPHNPIDDVVALDEPVDFGDEL